MPCLYCQSIDQRTIDKRTGCIVQSLTGTVSDCLVEVIDDEPKPDDKRKKDPVSDDERLILCLNLLSIKDFTKDFIFHMHRKPTIEEKNYYFDFIKSSNYRVEMKDIQTNIIGKWSAQKNNVDSIRQKLKKLEMEERERESKKPPEEQKKLGQTVVKVICSMKSSLRTRAIIESKLHKRIKGALEFENIDKTDNIKAGKIPLDYSIIIEKLKENCIYQDCVSDIEKLKENCIYQDCVSDSQATKKSPLASITILAETPLNEKEIRHRLSQLKIFPLTINIQHFD